jgi:hypothetical protein
LLGHFYRQRGQFAARGQPFNGAAFQLLMFDGVVLFAQQQNVGGQQGEAAAVERRRSSGTTHQDQNRQATRESVQDAAGACAVSAG